LIILNFMMTKIFLLLTLLGLTLSSACSDKKSKLAPNWSGENTQYSPTKKAKNKKIRQIKVNDEILREMAEHLFILQENASEELRVSEGLTFGATLFHYLGSFGNYQLDAINIMKLIKGFEELLGEPIDEKIMFVVEQVKSLTFSRNGKKYHLKIQGKEENGIVYFINEDNNEEGSALKKIKFVQAHNGSTVEFEAVDTLAEREELVKFVKDTGKRDSLHKDIHRNIEAYLTQEKPAPIIKMNFEGIIVRVLTDTIWKNINFRFKYGWSIPLFRVDGKNIPGFLLFLKKNFAKVKISIDQ
jgi:hypothetical protein